MYLHKICLLLIIGSNKKLKNNNVNVISIQDRFGSFIKILIIPHKFISQSQIIFYSNRAFTILMFNCVNAKKVLMFFTIFADNQQLIFPCITYIFTNDTSSERSFL